MVNKIKLKGKDAFECEECMFAYSDRKLAGKCENWCKKHKSCNLDIIRFAVQRK